MVTLQQVQVLQQQMKVTKPTKGFTHFQSKKNISDVRREEAAIFKNNQIARSQDWNTSLDGIKVGAR